MSEAGPSIMVPTMPLVEERENLINRILSLPVETQLNILGQMEDRQLINVCLINTEMLTLCFDPYLKVVKQWSHEDFLVFKLSVLIRCWYAYCKKLRDEVNQDLAEQVFKTFNLKGLIKTKFSKIC